MALPGDIRHLFSTLILTPLSQGIRGLGIGFIGIQIIVGYKGVIIGTGGYKLSTVRQGKNHAHCPLPTAPACILFLLDPIPRTSCFFVVMVVVPVIASLQESSRCSCSHYFPPVLTYSTDTHSIRLSNCVLRDSLTCFILLIVHFHGVPSGI